MEEHVSATWRWAIIMLWYQEKHCFFLFISRCNVPEYDLGSWRQIMVPLQDMHIWKLRHEVYQSTMGRCTNILLWNNEKQSFLCFISSCNAPRYIPGPWGPMQVPYMDMDIWKLRYGSISIHHKEVYQYPGTEQWKAFFPWLHIVVQCTRIYSWVHRSDAGTMHGYAHLETMTWKDRNPRYGDVRISSNGTRKSMCFYRSELRRRLLW